MFLNSTLARGIGWGEISQNVFTPAAVLRLSQVRSLWLLFVLKVSNSLSSCNSIKTFDFSTLYTNIPHSKLRDKLKELILLCFIKKNGQRRYKYLVLGRDKSHFVKDHSDSNKKFSETDIIKILEWQYICYVRRTCFSTDCRHSNGNKLCPFTCRLVSLSLWDWLRAGTS